VSQASPHEHERDRSLVSKIVLNKDLAPALDGIEGWSHIYVICWLDRVLPTEDPILHFPSTDPESLPLGILATRAPIHPNPFGLTLVELIRREGNVLAVRVLDIKPYPDWEQGRFIVVTDFRVPEWVTNGAVPPAARDRAQPSSSTSPR
jgi:tRNA (Thr-GGU) A37 N-methylase